MEVENFEHFKYSFMHASISFIVSVFDLDFKTATRVATSISQFDLATVTHCFAVFWNFDEIVFGLCNILLLVL